VVAGGRTATKALAAFWFIHLVDRPHGTAGATQCRLEAAGDIVVSASSRTMPSPSAGEALRIDSM